MKPAPADVEAIERATVAAVAPREVVEHRGWLAAFDDTTVNRARSAVPLSHEAPDTTAITHLHGLYRERGVMPNFRIARLDSMAPVQAQLARLALQPLQPTRVMVAPARAVASSADPAAVQLADEPDDAWAAVFLGEGFDPVDGASRVATLRRAAGSRFGAIREGGQAIAAGVLALSHGWASVHGMRTAQSHRGRGFASQLLAAFAAEALRQGCERMVLQVEEANPAQRVYQRAGFAHAWTYEYWRER